MSRLLTFSAVLFVVLFFINSIAAISDDCLRCICQVEGCHPGCVMDVGSLSCGYFQIKLPYYIDCGTPGHQPGQSLDAAWKQCADNLSCATTCVRNYMARYAARCSPNPGCETFARVHNGGPNGCKYSGTIGYWHKVQSCCGGKHC